MVSLQAFKFETCRRTKECLSFYCQRATVATHMTTIFGLHLTKPCPSRPEALAQRRQTVIPVTYYSQQKRCNGVKRLTFFIKRSLNFLTAAPAKLSKPELSSDDAHFVISSSFPICLPASGKEIKQIGDIAAPQPTSCFCA